MEKEERKRVGMSIDKILTIPIPYQFLLIDSIPYRFSYRFSAPQPNRSVRPAPPLHTLVLNTFLKLALKRANTYHLKASVSKKNLLGDRDRKSVV